VPQWGPFLVVVSALTVLLLVLARQSQQLISQQAHHGGEQTSSERAGDSERRAGGQTDIPAGSSTDTPEEVAGDTSADTPEVVVGDTANGTLVGTADDGTGRSGSAGARDGGAVDGAESGVTPDSTRMSESGARAGDSGAEVELTSRAMLANVASTQALFAGVVVAAAWYFSIPVAAFGVTAGSPAAGLRAVALGVGFGSVLWLANELATTVADAAGAAYDESVRGLLAPESTGGWVGLLLVVLPLVALAEELLFRAALVGVPAAGFDVSPWLLAVVASLAFALGHGAQGQVGVVVTGLLGLVLAAGYILTGSLLVVVVAHYVINALEFLLHEFLGVEAVWSFAVRSG
jgi:membrane protease YdiL (CAAX protease family)